MPVAFTADSRNNRRPFVDAERQKVADIRAGGAFALDQHHEVVGVPRKALASFFQCPVQIIEQDVGQQRLRVCRPDG